MYGENVCEKSMGKMFTNNVQKLCGKTCAKMCEKHVQNVWEKQMENCVQKYVQKCTGGTKLRVERTSHKSEKCSLLDICHFRTSYVQLLCDQSLSEPRFTASGEDPDFPQNMWVPYYLCFYKIYLMNISDFI